MSSVHVLVARAGELWTSAALPATHVPPDSLSRHADLVDLRPDDLADLRPDDLADLRPDDLADRRFSGVGTV